MESYVGRGRDAMEQILDDGSFMENVIGGESAHEDIAPGAVVGTGAIYGRTVTIIGTDAMEWNERFPCVAAGIIGLEEAFKMAAAVYRTIEADDKNDEKTPVLLIVDTPGNGPGKVEEIVGMNKATGAYQLALAKARQHGHPVIAMVIGRAISGAFLCHGLQADRILSLPKDMGTMIHVMPLSSIARITKMDIERLEELSESNPVFAAGAEFFYKLGGIDEIVMSGNDMTSAIDMHIREVYTLNKQGLSNELGPWGRGLQGERRGGRTTRKEVVDLIKKEANELENFLLT